MSVQFSPTRGVFQRDPSSPYLFVLAMERLGHLINRAINLGEWCPIRISRPSPPFSFLFINDNLLLFGEASIQQMMVIKDCLEVFGLASG